MKRTLFLLMAAACSHVSIAQYVYTINADSVKITNHCDTAELIIENHTQNVPGFLFNKGRGRTEFRKAFAKLDDTTFLIGGDTVSADLFSLWRKNGNHIYNINTGNVGIHRTNPNTMLDLPGSVNIDDTSSFRIGYHPVVRLRDISDYCSIEGVYCTGPGVQSYTSLYVGDSTGKNDADEGNTFTGNAAGYNNSGGFNTFMGFVAGHDNVGANQTFVGFRSGENCGINESGGATGGNSFLGSFSGINCTGDMNVIEGYYAGSDCTGSNNTYIGASAGGSADGSSNQFIGTNCGAYCTGSNNTYIGTGAGSSNTGSNSQLVGAGSGQFARDTNSVLMGYFAGRMSHLNESVAIGHMAGYSSSGTKLTMVGSNAWAYAGTSNASAVGAEAVAKTSNTMVFGDSYVTSWIFGPADATSGKALIVGSGSNSGNGAYLTTGGVWTNASDRNKKENFEAINTADMLEKIASLPITRWNYKGLTEQHIGPVAQDFYRIFHLGNDDKNISTIDPSGIALAGIQELYRQWQATQQQNREQQTTITDQQARITGLQSQLEQQQAQLDNQQTQLNQVLEKLNSLESALSNSKQLH